LVANTGLSVGAIGVLGRETTGALSSAGRLEVASTCEGLVIGPLAIVVAGDAIETWDGLVIGPSTGIGESVDGDGITMLGAVVMLGEVAMAGVVATVGVVAILGVLAILGAASAYGSIGRISPDGPACGDGVATTSITAGPYGSIGCIAPDGPAPSARGTGGDATAVELDARGSACAGFAASSGSTT